MTNCGVAVEAQPYSRTLSTDFKSTAPISDQQTFHLLKQAIEVSDLKEFTRLTSQLRFCAAYKDSTPTPGRTYGDQNNIFHILLASSCSQKAEMLNVLLSHSQNIAALSDTNTDGETPLLVLFNQYKSDLPSCVDYLIKYLPAPKLAELMLTTDVEGNTPLHKLFLSSEPLPLDSPESIRVMVNKLCNTAPLIAQGFEKANCKGGSVGIIITNRRKNLPSNEQAQKAVLIQIASLIKAELKEHNQTLTTSIKLSPDVTGICTQSFIQRPLSCSPQTTTTPELYEFSIMRKGVKDHTPLLASPTIKNPPKSTPSMARGSGQACILDRSIHFGVMTPKATLPMLKLPPVKEEASAEDSSPRTMPSTKQPAGLVIDISKSSFHLDPAEFESSINPLLHPPTSAPVTRATVRPKPRFTKGEVDSQFQTVVQQFIQVMKEADPKFFTPQRCGYLSTVIQGNENYPSRSDYFKKNVFYEWDGTPLINNEIYKWMTTELLKLEQQDLHHQQMISHQSAQRPHTSQLAAHDMQSTRVISPQTIGQLTTEQIKAHWPAVVSQFIQVMRQTAPHYFTDLRCFYMQTMVDGHPNFFLNVVFYKWDGTACIGKENYDWMMQELQRLELTDASAPHMMAQQAAQATHHSQGVVSQAQAPIQTSVVPISPEQQWQQNVNAFIGYLNSKDPSHFYRQNEKQIRVVISKNSKYFAERIFPLVNASMDPDIPFFQWMDSEIKKQLAATPSQQPVSQSTLQPQKPHVASSQEVIKASKPEPTTTPVIPQASITEPLQTPAATASAKAATSAATAPTERIDEGWIETRGTVFSKLVNESHGAIKQSDRNEVNKILLEHQALAKEIVDLEVLAKELDGTHYVIVSKTLELCNLILTRLNRPPITELYDSKDRADAIRFGFIEKLYLNYPRAFPEKYVEQLSDICTAHQQEIEELHEKFDQIKFFNLAKTIKIKLTAKLDGGKRNIQK